jgi:hypothetical protein
VEGDGGTVFVSMDQFREATASLMADVNPTRTSMMRADSVALAHRMRETSMSLRFRRRWLALRGQALRFRYDKVLTLDTHKQKANLLRNLGGGFAVLTLAEQIARLSEGRRNADSAWSPYLPPESGPASSAPVVPSLSVPEGLRLDAGRHCDAEEDACDSLSYDTGETWTRDGLPVWLTRPEVSRFCSHDAGASLAWVNGMPMPVGSGAS